MPDVRRILNRRTLALAARPATWRAGIAQQAWRLQRQDAPNSDLRGAAGTPVIHWPAQYRHENIAKFADPVRAGLGMLASVEPRAIPQPYKGIVVFDVEHQTETFSVAVDTYDATSIERDCLEHVALYFKMQHLRTGYGDPKIVPGGYIAGKPALYDYLPRLRDLRRRPYKFDVYGRFGTMFSADIRRRAVALLQEDNRFKFTGGTSLTLYMQALREAARARVCIDMPGNGPFCFRLVEYLAIGCCVIGPRHATTMHEDLLDREHIVYCKDDLSDLPDLCMRYLHNHEAREAVGANAARFFDEHLNRLKLGSHYLRLLSALPSRQLSATALAPVS
jgi:hypothetical protein